MATDGRFEKAISSWFEETAASRVPERVLDATFERTRTTRQRAGWPALLGRLHLTRSALAIGSAAVLVAVAALSLELFVDQRGVGELDPSDPRSPFRGIWVNAADADGSTQTMTVRASGDDAVEIVVRDDLASVCSGAPSTMTGTGRPGSSNELVIPAPVYTCDDGSEPEAMSGPPLEQQLRNLTFVFDSENDTLTDNFGAVWTREGAAPSPTIAISARGWPQSTTEEVRHAQERADAGDPGYTWQVDPKLMDESTEDSEIIARFLEEELGWEAFLPNPFLGGDGFADDGIVSDVVYIRCAPGRTNPLYPHDDTFGGGDCAPTIDELRYETVTLELGQPGRRSPSGIWVVTRWAMLAPFAQVVPPSAEAGALVEDFLQARIDGAGAEGFVEFRQEWSTSPGVPLLYATSDGARYERFEVDPVVGPHWPFGNMEYKVRLFADGGKTVVEQLLFLTTEAERLSLEYRHKVRDVAPTTENGRPVALPYRLLDGGQLTVLAAHPWGETWFNGWTLLVDNNHEERIEFVADPLPVGTGCEQGPLAVDAAALARSIRSDPDLEATAPEAVSMGGIGGLQMDVVLAQGASVCVQWGSPQVLTPDDDDDWHGVAMDHASRMRLYLLDAPEGSSIRILAISIVAPEARFEQVMELAAPVVDSIEFPTR